MFAAGQIGAARPLRREHTFAPAFISRSHCFFVCIGTMRPTCGTASRLAFATAGADDPRTRRASVGASTVAPDRVKARVAASGNAANVYDQRHQFTPFR